jgi:hypothetical protein
MTASPVQPKIWSPREAAVRWWRKWTDDGATAKLQCCLEQDVERIAQDIGVSKSELHRLVRQGPGSADLLLRRMAALDLDPKEVTVAEPATFRDLQRVCSMCESKRRCARDMAGDCTLAAWPEYCPNTATLQALNAMPWSSRQEW